MSSRNLLISLVLTTSVIAGVQPAVSGDKLRVAYSVWIGYGPLFIAEKKGFFKEQGLDVELVPIEDTKLRFASLVAGQIDLMATSVDALPQYIKPTQSYRYVFGLDESSGADGILFSNSIKQPSDLKGKSVAYGQGTVMEFFLSAVLEKAHLNLKDVETVNMTGGDAGSAFSTGQVDAAVTWDPYLSKGASSKYGYKYTDTKSWPGLIADVMIARADKIGEQQDAIDRLYKAWAQAVDYTKTNPDDANAIMGEGLGGWLAKPDVIKDVLTGVKLMDGARNKTYFGNAPGSGDILPVIEKALNLWRGQGKMQIDIKADDLVDRHAMN